MEVGLVVGVIAALLAMLLMGAPIAFALIVSSVVGLILLDGLALTSQAVATIPYSSVASYFSVLIPLYIVMGVILAHGGVTDQLYKVASHVLRRVPGALGVATIAACAGFAAVTGSSIATAATLGRVSVRVMRENGYPASFAAGIVAAGGTLGVLIPPSIVLVIYGIVADVSISSLLIAGFIPGVISALSYIIYIILRERWVTVAATPAQVLVDVSDEASRSSASSEVASNVVRNGEVPYSALVWILTIFTIVVSGIYVGFFTVIEAGAIAAVVAVGGMVARELLRRRPLRDLLVHSFSETVAITSMIFLLLVGGALFSYFLVRSGATQTVISLVTESDLPPYGVLLAVLLLMIPLGMMLDPLSVIVIIGPVAHPIMVALGFDGVWFAILFVRMIEVAMVTPPVGMNVFVVSGASGVSVQEVFRGVFPFVVVDLLVIGLLVAFPSLVTLLPDLVRN